MYHRSISSRSQQRRRPNQPFSSSVTIPNKSDPALEAPLNSRPLRNSDSRSNSSDPFVVPPSSANSVESSKQTGTNSGPKPLAFRPPPPLANRPTGKLARRRQPPSVDLVGFTIPSVTPTKAPSVARNYASLGSRRSVPRRASSSIPLTSWDFPICDDSDDNTPPSTPVRESASVPLKKTAATWQQKALFDEPLRTAPASSTFSYPFTSTPSPSPTPAQRRRHHRVPSEGVFAMSTDEESSDTSDDSAAANSLKRRSPSATRRTPSPTPDLSTSATPGFYAGSVFQNSPSPDELPVPAFMA